jgi:uncharacterized protein
VTVLFDVDPPGLVDLDVPEVVIAQGSIEGVVLANFVAEGQVRVYALLGEQELFVDLAAVTAGRCEPTQVVISQVYGGGGNTGAPFTHDFVELHNRSRNAVTIGGWSVQYTSAAGTSWGGSNKFDIPAGTVMAPGAYFLVQMAAGAGNGVALPTPDGIGAATIGANNAKILLATTTTAQTGNCPSGPAVVDLVGYGTADCGEGGTKVAALTNTTAAIRKANRCQDTNDNAADFEVAAPSPRNSASTPNDCACN